MLKEISCGNGITLRPCRAEWALDCALYVLKDWQTELSLAAQSAKIPAAITGFQAQSPEWTVVALQLESDFLLALPGDLLAVRMGSRLHSGQIALLNVDGLLVLRRVFVIGPGWVLQPVNGGEAGGESLVLPTAVSVQGVVMGIAMENLWYQIITANKPKR
jgi:hypothetical protein